ncbi:MAG: HAD hydrolase-like protein [Desulfovibrio sp.]|nr:HAD hydrolase-like protein [Desulfovibrio sp.]
MYQRGYRGKTSLVVLDLAGTLCDGSQDLRRRWPEDDMLGCKAPVLPFYALFQRHGITLEWPVIRQFMGMYKPDHLRLLLELPEVREQYLRLYGHPYTRGEYLAWLEEFRVLLAQFALDDDLARPVDGAGQCLAELRQADILVGYDTGYFNGIANALVQKLADQHGLFLDVGSNSDVAHGRPSPGMIYDCMMKAKVWPSEAVVKVDDTAAGILSGNNAGCWTVGIYASGSHTYDKLQTARPDFLLPSIKYLPALIFSSIDPRIRAGGRPGHGFL